MPNPNPAKRLAKLTVKTATASVNFFDDICVTREWFGGLTVCKHTPGWFASCQEIAFFESYEYYAFDVPVDEPANAAVTREREATKDSSGL